MKRPKWEESGFCDVGFNDGSVVRLKLEEFIRMEAQLRSANMYYTCHTAQGCRVIIKLMDVNTVVERTADSLAEEDDFVNAVKFDSGGPF